MLATIAENCIHVTLSRRNLRALQAMLDRDLPRTALVRSGEDGVLLVLEVENDVEHYRDRGAGLRLARSNNVA
jgi:hypothetical protein